MLKYLIIIIVFMLIILIIKPKKFDKYTCEVVLPLQLISNGEIIYSNLYLIKKDKNWLINTLNKKGIHNIEDVENGVILSSGILDVNLYPTVKDKEI